jgi:hypothetical protein
MLFNGNWAYWELRHKVTFDPVLRHIIVNPGVSEINIKTDVYSASKEWMKLDKNSAFPQAIRATGSDPIPGGFTGATFFLINGWKLVLDLTVVRVNGVLFSDDFETAFYSPAISPVFPATVSSLVNQTVTTQNVVTGDVNAVPAAVWDMVLSPTPPVGSAADLQLKIRALAQAIMALSA